MISWELPTDPDVHLHRIGRTGRAGHKGLALALCSPSERGRALAIERAQGGPLHWAPAPASDERRPAPPAITTLILEGGRQDKLRVGDLLGALTGDIGLAGAQVGKIDIHARRSYVAIRREHAVFALAGPEDPQDPGAVLSCLGARVMVCWTASAVGRRRSGRGDPP